MDNYEACSWGVAPGNAIVVSSAMDVKERLAIQRYLETAVEKYGKRAPLIPQPTLQDQNVQTGGKFKQ